jgi:type VI secretion system secreted protein Hcp
MAVDMFLNIDDKKIKGESIDKKHADEIDVLAWSWGASQSGTTHMGTGGGSGKASFQDLSLTKYMDLASPTLLEAVAKGDHFKKCVLVVRKAGGNDPLEYFVLTLEDCIITSYSTGGSGGEDRLTENISINFARYKIDYQSQSDQGVKKGTATTNFDIAKNAKA